MRPADMLLEEPRPLLVRRQLAVAVGLQEAIQLQQLHWLLDHYDSRSVELDGRRWLRGEMRFWCAQFPWASEATIRRAFDNLRTHGLVERNRGRESSVYAINYPAVDALARSAQDELGDSSHRAERPAQDERSASIGEGGKEVERTSATEAVAEAEQQLFESPTSPAQADESDDAIASIWTEYLTVFGDRVRVKELTDRRRTMIRKALKAVAGDAELCKRAIHGLKSYRASHPEGSNRVDLGVIFETNMRDSKNLTDKIEGWAELADRTIPGTASTSTVPLDLAGVPSVTKGTIQARRREVAQMYDHPESPDARKRGEAAVDWLKENVGHAPNIVDGQLKGWRFA